jgi:flavin-dependent dehydrogenase
MDDVIIAGGGPAGALAAILLARGGARVRLFDRARFPRAKLCGDTLNPGAFRVLGAHLDIDELRHESLRLSGMVLTGPGGVTVRGSYGGGLVGYALERRVLDHWLLDRAAEAGAAVETDSTVEDAIVTGGTVYGVHVRAGGRLLPQRAHVVIAADGRRSKLAFGLGLARHPKRPRRWAIGAYFKDVEGLTSAGEMHVRRGHYIGVAPLPGGLTNACVVVPHHKGPDGWRDAAGLLVSTLAQDAVLAPRFARAHMIDAPTVLGPMAVDVKSAAAPGLLLAGDAAGFIDPMTGDGLRFALVGAALAAETAAEILAGNIDPFAAVTQLQKRRRRAFARKWRFNRALRRLVASPNAVAGAALAARGLPGAFRAMIRYAGDVGA